MKTTTKKTKKPPKTAVVVLPYQVIRLEVEGECANRIRKEAKNLASGIVDLHELVVPSSPEDVCTKWRWMCGHAYHLKNPEVMHVLAALEDSRKVWLASWDELAVVNSEH